MSAGTSNTIVLTHEELAKIIVMSVGGFVEGVLNARCPVGPKDFYKVTLESIVDEKLHEEFITGYDELVAELDQEEQQTEDDE